MAKKRGGERMTTAKGEFIKNCKKAKNAKELKGLTIKYLLEMED